MSNALIPTIDTNKINTTIAFGILMIYLILISWYNHGFPDMKEVETITIILMNVSFISLVVIILGSANWLRKYFGHIRNLKYFYGSDENILLDNRQFQQLMENPVTKVVIGMILLFMSIGLILFKDFQYSYINHFLIAASENRDVTALSIFLVLSTGIGTFLVNRGYRKAELYGLFSWHYVFMLRLERLERIIPINLDTSSMQLQIDIQSSNHHHVQDLIRKDNLKIQEKLETYLEQIKTDTTIFRDSEVPELKSWGYPLQTIFIENLDDQASDYRSTSILKESTNYYDCNLSDEVEFHPTIFDILFDKQNAYWINKLAEQHISSLRLLIELDYLLSLMAKYMLLCFYETIGDKKPLSEWFDTDFLMDGVIIENPNNYNRHKLNIQSAIWLKYILVFGLREKPSPIDLRNEAFDIQYKTSSHSLNEYNIQKITFSTDILRQLNDFSHEKISEFTSKLFNITDVGEDITKSLKFLANNFHELGIDQKSIDPFPKQFALVDFVRDSNRQPFQILFNMLQSEMSFFTYFNATSIHRDTLVKKIRDERNEISRILGSLNTDDLIFNQIERRLGNENWS